MRWVESVRGVERGRNWMCEEKRNMAANDSKKNRRMDVKCEREKRRREKSVCTWEQEKERKKWMCKRKMRSVFERKRWWGRVTEERKRKVDSEQIMQIVCVCLKVLKNKSVYIYIYRTSLPQIGCDTRPFLAGYAGHCWRSRDELIRDVLLWTPTHGRVKAGRPARTYIQQLCENTGCCPEDLPEAMNDMEKWRERVMDIRATSTIWWWWWKLVWIQRFYSHSKADRATCLSTNSWERCVTQTVSFRNWTLIAMSIT